MKEVLTNDGSYTFYNEQYQETYHSTSGAIEEAFEKFAIPCKLKDSMDVLDVCFGLGYNSLAAISLANVQVVALENDQTIIDEIKHISINKEAIQKYNNKNTIVTNFEKIKKCAVEGFYEDGAVSLQLLMDDARQSIKKINRKFDVVFLDPFSPKKCPDLWTEAFFKNIFAVMKPGAVLATYSCARIVRENLTNAGFTVTEGPIVGRRSPGTLAYTSI